MMEGVMQLTSVMCSFHRKPSLAWRFDSGMLLFLTLGTSSESKTKQYEGTRGEKEGMTQYLCSWAYSEHQNSCIFWLFFSGFMSLPVLSACCLMLPHNWIQHNHGRMLLQGHHASIQMSAWFLALLCQSDAPLKESTLCCWESPSTRKTNCSLCNL